MTDKNEKCFYVQIRRSSDDYLEQEKGPYTEHQAVKIADGMEVNMSDKFYTEVVDHD